MIRQKRRIIEFLSSNINKISKVEIVLYFLISFCLFIDWIYLSYSNLNSDNVHAGLLSRDIWKYGIEILREYRLPADDPYIFTDTIPFHLLPQKILGFSPIALKISSFFIFLLIVILFSYIIYKLSQEKMRALLFAAFFISIPPASSLVFMLPTNHNATILFIGLLILLGWRYSQINKIHFIISLIIMSFVIYSDSIFLIWFLIPLYTTYFILDKKYLFENFPIHVLIILILGILFIYKKMFILQFRHHIFTFFFDFEKIFSNIIISIKNYVYLYNNYLFYDGKLINLFFIFIIIPILIIFIHFIIKLMRYELNKNFIKIVSSHQLSLLNKIFLQFSALQHIFLFSFSFLVPSLIYIFTNYEEMGAIRYLTYSFLAFLVIIFLVCSLESKIIKASIIFIIIINSGLGFYSIVTYDEFPNSEAYHLIDSLKKYDLTFGYGEYWDANLLTYLSGEEIIIRPIIYRDGDIYPFEWLTCDCWYKDNPRDFFILVGDRNREIITYTEHNPPDNIIIINNYTILSYSNHTLPNISSFTYVTFDKKMQYILQKLKIPHF